MFIEAEGTSKKMQLFNPSFPGMAFNRLFAFNTRTPMKDSKAFTYPQRIITIIANIVNPVYEEKNYSSRRRGSRS
jgi:hypothetical protein